jgi:hypothetical protein
MKSSATNGGGGLLHSVPHRRPSRCPIPRHAAGGYLASQTQDPTSAKSDVTSHWCHLLTHAEGFMTLKVNSTTRKAGSHLRIHQPVTLVRAR